MHPPSDDDSNSLSAALAGERVGVRWSALQKQWADGKSLAHLT